MGTQRYWDGTKWIGEPQFAAPSALADGANIVDELGLEKANPWFRLIGALIDLVIIATVSGIIALALGIIDEDSSAFQTTNVGLSVVAIAVWAIYQTILVGSVGATVGKLLFGYRVYNLETGEQAGAATAAIRGIPAAVFYNLPLLGVVAIVVSVVLFFTDARGRALHDRVASTVVVKRP